MTTAMATTTMTALAGTAAGKTGGRGGEGHGEGHGRAQTASGRLYELRSGRQRAVIAGVSATLLSWQYDDTELLVTHPADEVGGGYQGKTILPWPNRIDQGRYTFEGEQLQVPINEPSRESALHGLMNFVEWEPVHHSRDRVVLEYLLHPQYGYPFPMSFRIEFRLDERGIRSTLTSRNVGRTNAPLGTAVHPYVAAGSGTIDSIEFELPAGTYYVTNDRLIPTGKAPVEGTKYDFRAARPLGPTTMDTAFTDLERDSRGETVVKFGRTGGVDIHLWMDDAYDYIQVYTDDAPSTERPARSGLVVEPMTCPPNAFVTGEGVIVLRPGEEHTGSWGYRIVS